MANALFRPFPISTQEKISEDVPVESDRSDFMFFYADHPERGGVNVARMKATKAYLKHYGNALELKKIVAHTTCARDKAQAVKELMTAERKCAWWERKEGFDLVEALSGIKALKQASGPASKAA